ncbi:hypothetical protein PQX77_019087 [Marasmius sp. AFHP31]|nr:hypothetical protein PQX77_019087 [Marasmius sp. AFHP31]
MSSLPDSSLKEDNTSLQQSNNPSMISVTTDNESVHHGQQKESTFSSPYQMNTALMKELGINVDNATPSTKIFNSGSQVLDGALDRAFGALGGALGLLMTEVQSIKHIVWEALLKQPAPGLIESSDGKSEGLVNLNGFKGFLELNQKQYSQVKYWHSHDYKKPQHKKNKNKKGKKGDEDDDKDEEAGKQGPGWRLQNQNVKMTFIKGVDGNQQKLLLTSRDPVQLARKDPGLNLYCLPALLAKVQMCLHLQREQGQKIWLRLLEQSTAAKAHYLENFPSATIGEFWLGSKTSQKNFGRLSTIDLKFRPQIAF